MKYHVVVEDIARDDIVRNAQWWSEHHSNEQAVLWYDMTVKSLDSLAINPERHALSPENSSFDFEIHELLFGLGIATSLRKSIRAQCFAETFPSSQRYRAE